MGWGIRRSLPFFLSAKAGYSPLICVFGIRTCSRSVEQLPSEHIPGVSYLSPMVCPVGCQGLSIGTLLSCAILPHRACPAQ
jgi:hypothetical protein